MKKRKLTQRQQKLVKNLAAGMKQGNAADKNPSQSAYQALQEIQRRMPELLDDLGLTDRAIIEKHLVPLLEATETKFFPYRLKIAASPAKAKQNKNIEKH